MSITIHKKLESCTDQEDEQPKQTLVSKEISKTEQGYYTCKTMDDKSQETLTAEKCSLSIVNPLKDTEAKESGSVTLSCEFSSSPTMVHWFKGETRLESSRKYNTNQIMRCAELIIQDLEGSDSGEYCCQAGSCESKATLTVEVRRVKIVKHLRDAEVDEDSCAAFSCELNYSDVDAQWFLNKKRLWPCSANEIEHVDKTHSLILKRLPPEDSMVTIQAENTSESAFLKIIEKPAVFVKPLKNMVGEEEDTVSLECEVSKPLVFPIWKKDGVVLATNDKYQMLHVSRFIRLIIHDLRKEDTGEYCCDVGTDQTKSMVSVKDITIEFIKRLKTVEVKEGDTCSFECALSKSINNKYFWTLNGRPVVSHGRFQITTEKWRYKMSIKEVNLSDSGDVVFTIRNLSSKTMLFVKEKPVRVYRDMQNLSVTPGEDAELSCEITKCDAKIKWLKDGKTIMKSPKYEFIHRENLVKLVIRDAMFVDSGEYRCEIGGTSSRAKLVVKELGHIFSRELRDTTVEEKGLAVLECETRRPAVRSTWLKGMVILQPGRKYKMKQRGNVHSLTITGLEKWDSDMYTCDVGTAQSRAVLTVQEQRVVFVEELEDKICAERDTVVFKSHIFPSDYCNVRWYLDRTLLHTDNRNEIQILPGGCHSLTMRNLVRKDSGVITLEAGDKKAYAFLLIREKHPVITKALQDCKAVEGENLILSCKTSKVFHILWYKDGSLIWNSSKYFVRCLANEATLTIYKVNETDAGLYECIAGPDSTKARVTVNSHHSVPQPMEDASVQGGESPVFTTIIKEPLPDMEHTAHRAPVPGTTDTMTRRTITSLCQISGGEQPCKAQPVVEREETEEKIIDLRKREPQILCKIQKDIERGTFGMVRMEIPKACRDSFVPRYPKYHQKSRMKAQAFQEMRLLAHISQPWVTCLLDSFCPHQALEMVAKLCSSCGPINHLILKYAVTETEVKMNVYQTGEGISNVLSMNICNLDIKDSLTCDGSVMVLQSVPELLPDTIQHDPLTVPKDHHGQSITSLSSRSSAENDSTLINLFQLSQEKAWKDNNQLCVVLSESMTISDTSNEATKHQEQSRKLRCLEHQKKMLPPPHSEARDSSLGSDCVSAQRLLGSAFCSHAQEVSHPPANEVILNETKEQEQAYQHLSLSLSEELNYSLLEYREDKGDAADRRDQRSGPSHCVSMFTSISCDSGVKGPQSAMCKQHELLDDYTRMISGRTDLRESGVKRKNVDTLRTKEAFVCHEDDKDDDARKNADNDPEKSVKSALDTKIGSQFSYSLAPDKAVVNEITLSLMAHEKLEYSSITETRQSEHTFILSSIQPVETDQLQQNPLFKKSQLLIRGSSEQLDRPQDIDMFLKDLETSQKSLSLDRENEEEALFSLHSPINITDLGIKKSNKDKQVAVSVEVENPGLLEIKQDKWSEDRKLSAVEKSESTNKIPHISYFQESSTTHQSSNMKTFSNFSLSASHSVPHTRPPSGTFRKPAKPPSGNFGNPALKPVFWSRSGTVKSSLKKGVEKLSGCDFPSSPQQQQKAKDHSISKKVMESLSRFSKRLSRKHNEGEGNWSKVASPLPKTMPTHVGKASSHKRSSSESYKSTDLKKKKDLHNLFTSVESPEVPDTGSDSLAACKTYSILSEINRGHFSVVMLCQDNQSKRLFAAKITPYKPEQRLALNEYLVLRKLEHTHIVQLHSAFITSRYLILIEELCAGRELLHNLAERDLYAELHVAELLQQILCAVAYLHNHCIVHLDLTSENILVTDHNLLKIVDLGSAQIFTPGQTLSMEHVQEMKESKVRIAHPKPPEVLERQGLGPETDIWAIGVLVFIMLSGDDPFQSELLWESENNVRKGKIKLGRCYPGLSNGSVSFIKKTLNHKPWGRPSAAECLQIPWVKGLHRSSLCSDSIVCFSTDKLQAYLLEQETKREKACTKDVPLLH